MGLGRWEEAQVNFEAADAALQANVNDPNCGIDLVHRKHTLMTNIGHLMVKRGNVSWGLLFGREVVSHPRVSEYNKGWAYLVIGEAELGLGNLRTPMNHTMPQFRSLRLNKHDSITVLIQMSIRTAVSRFKRKEITGGLKSMPLSWPHCSVTVQPFKTCVNLRLIFGVLIPRPLSWQDCLWQSKCRRDHIESENFSS